MKMHKIVLFPVKLSMAVGFEVLAITGGTWSQEGRKFTREMRHRVWKWVTD